MFALPHARVPRAHAGRACGEARKTALAATCCTKHSCMTHRAPTCMQTALILVGAGIFQSYAPSAGGNGDADAPAQIAPVAAGNGPLAPTYSRGVVAAGKPTAVVSNTAFAEAAGGSAGTTNIADEAFGQVPPTAPWRGARTLESPTVCVCAFVWCPATDTRSTLFPGCVAGGSAGQHAVRHV